MGMTYEHYFSEIPCPQPNDQLATTDLITYHTYQVTKRLLTELIRALIDGRANGGIGGRDMAIVEWQPNHWKVNIGIVDDHQMTGLQLATFAAYIKLDQGPFIGIFNNYAHCPDQTQSIHSKIQLQANNIMVNDTSKTFGGQQMLRTNCKKQVTLQYVAGLPYLEQRPPTKAEMMDDDIPHIIMTSEGT